MQIEVDTGTVTGSGVTCDIVVEGASDSGFTTDVVQYGQFGTIDESDDDIVLGLTTYIDSRYLRVNATIAGSSPSIPLVVSAREPHYKRVTDDGTQFPDSQP